MDTVSYEIKEVDAAEWQRIHAEAAALRQLVAEFEKEDEEFLQELCNALHVPPGEDLLWHAIEAGKVYRPTEVQL